MVEVVKVACSCACTSHTPLAMLDAWRQTIHPRSVGLVPRAVQYTSQVEIWRGLCAFSSPTGANHARLGTSPVVSTSRTLSPRVSTVLSATRDAVTIGHCYHNCAWLGGTCAKPLRARPDVSC